MHRRGQGEVMKTAVLGKSAAHPAPAVPTATPPPPSEKTLFRPAPPKNLQEAGVTEAMVDSLVFKYLLMSGSAAGARIAEVLAFPHPIIVERLADLKRQQLV